MKKVLALVLAAIMVCTMAFAVEINGSTNTNANTTKAQYTVLPGSTISFETAELFDVANNKYAKDTDGNFLPDSNKVYITFGTGSNFVASQGWVKVDNTKKTQDAYKYVITLTKDATKAADEAIDLSITKVEVKATGFDQVKAVAVTNATAGATATNVTGTPVATIGTDNKQLTFDIGYATGTPIPMSLTADGKKAVVTEADLEAALTADLEFHKVATVVVGGTNASEATMTINDKTNINGNTTAGIYVTAVVKANASYLLCVSTDDLAATPGAGTFFKTDAAKKAYEKLIADANATVKASYVDGAKGNIAFTAKAYNLTAGYAYLVNADGTVTALNGTLDDGVLTFTGSVLGNMIVTDKPLAATGSTGTGTTNPNTGANDVIGVAAALAVVALVSGAAISLKK